MRPRPRMAQWRREEGAAAGTTNLREATPVVRREPIDAARDHQGPENAGYEKDRAEQTADEWQQCHHL
jgi:hypothetical protein